MPTEQPYQITTTNQEVVITLKPSLMEREKLEQFLDYLTSKAIQQKKPVN